MRQLDDTHAEFDQDMLIDFVTDVSKALATVSGRTKVLLRGLHLAERATEMLQVCSVGVLLRSSGTAVSWTDSHC